MPSASANMSAKFIAQIEISNPCVSSARRPAEETSPRIVSRSGSPAAASVPKASTRIASVTGQERSSDVIIALRLAVLKSDHIPEEPVRETRDVLAAQRAELPLQRVGRGDHRRRVALRAGGDHGRVSVRGDRERRPAGAAPSPTCAFVRSVRSTCATVCRNAGSAVVACREWTTTISAELERPPKLRWIRARACTDSEPEACQPAPESALSTLGAKTASETATTAHARVTARV